MDPILGSILHHPSHSLSCFFLSVGSFGWWSQEPGWKVSEMLWDANGPVFERFLLLVSPHKGAKWCCFYQCRCWSDAKASSVQPEHFRLFAAQVLEGLRPTIFCWFPCSSVWFYKKDLTAYILRVPFKSFQCLQYFVSCQSNVLKRCQPWMWWPRRPLWSHVGVMIQLRSTRYVMCNISLMSYMFLFVVSPGI